MAATAEIGRVFTPLNWAAWLIDEIGAFTAWCEGATICDPTFGEGAFIEALLVLARRRGVEVSRNLASRLYGVELDARDKAHVLELARARYQVELAGDNFVTGDILSPALNRRFDVLLGNPPWVNFSALPDSHKGLWADSYIDHGLVRSRKDVLLGGSRADLATLILKKVIDRNLAGTGKCGFFIPLSIFFNSGSNDRFRPYPGSPHGYGVKELWDFGDEKIFDGIATRYGAVHIQKALSQAWPVPTHVREDGEWRLWFSTSTDEKQGFWQRHQMEGDAATVPVVMVDDEQRPRQGINTCGANAIFLLEKRNASFINGLGEITEIEDDLVFPLMDKEAFRASGEMCGPRRFILVPHSRHSGKPLSPMEIGAFPKAIAYLTKHKATLEQRKGTMLNAHIQRGLWWSLLGVGPYSFAPWKVIWEALGREVFRPKVVPGEWQGNQALHAFCPCESRAVADQLAEALSDPAVESFLKASTMGGTMNWAQPGRVSKLLTYRNTQQSLFA